MQVCITGTVPGCSKKDYQNREYLATDSMAAYGKTFLSTKNACVLITIWSGGEDGS